MAASSALHDYLDHLRIIHGSTIASDERSYYPALDSEMARRIAALLALDVTYAAVKAARLDLRVPAAAVASFASEEWHPTNMITYTRYSAFCTLLHCDIVWPGSSPRGHGVTWRRQFGYVGVLDSGASGTLGDRHRCPTRLDG